MDQYFNQMDKIIKERKTTSRIRFMLQDVLDLRQVKTQHKPSLVFSLSYHTKGHYFTYFVFVNYGNFPNHIQ